MRYPPNTTTKSPSIMGFVVRYVLLMGAFLLLIGYKTIRSILDIDGLYSQAIVSLTAFFLRIIGVTVQAKGITIMIPNAAMEVRFGCNGLEAVLIYCAALLAFPSPWKKKIMGIFAGFVIIEVLNIFRIVALLLVKIHFPDFFELFHIYIAQGIMIAVALVLFIVWVEYASNKR